MDTQEKRKILESYHWNSLEIQESRTSRVEELVEQNRKIEKAIDEVENQKERLALTKVYLNNKKQEKAAEEMNYAVKHFQKILSDGVKNINL